MRATVIRTLCLALLAAPCLALAATSTVDWQLREAGTPVGATTYKTQALCDAAARALDRTAVYECVRRVNVTGTPPPAGTPKLTLSNLPPAITEATSISVTYALTGGAGTVYCRRDGYAPALLPSPLVMGATVPLDAGPHKLDCYVSAKGDGSDIDAAKPAASHAWEIKAPVVVTPPPTAGALPPAPLPVPTEVSGSSAQWDGSTAITANGVTMMARVADPSGSGRMVNLHRITQGGASIWGGQRSEQLWIGKPAQALNPGTDFWMAFAVQRKADETFGSTSEYDAHLVFQTHTPQAGDTQPDIALFASGQSGNMFWRVAYNTSGAVDGNGWMRAEGNPQVHAEPMPAPGVWRRYVLHYRPGYLASHNPLFEVWRAKPGEAYEKIVTHTGFNTYNTSKTGAGASYPRIGLYKWTGSVWNGPSIAWYITPLYFGTGADLLEAGKAALNGL